MSKPEMPKYIKETTKKVLGGLETMTKEYEQTKRTITELGEQQRNTQAGITAQQEEQQRFAQTTNDRIAQQSQTVAQQSQTIEKLEQCLGNLKTTLASHGIRIDKNIE